MSMQILSLVLYSHSGRKRTIEFRPGRVNIITGRSRTGKSAIIDIIDYCLGNSQFRVPEGIIKDTVSWYGLLLEVRDGTQVFIAKPTPKADAISQSEAYYEIGTTLTPPSFEVLVRNSNDNEIIASLSRLLGITPNLSIRGESESRVPLEAHLRHTAYYLYQDQGLVANREILFHRQMEEFIPRTIKDTLPFFLGVVESDRIGIERELREARRALKLSQRDLEEAEAIISDRLKRGMSLIAEAQQVGLIDPKLEYKTNDEVIAALQSVAAWKPTTIPATEDERAPLLRDEIYSLKELFRQIKGKISISESYIRDSRGYSSEAAQQLMRLKSINLFNIDSDSNNTCPLCNSAVSSPVPAISDIRESIISLSTDLETVQRESPRLREYIDKLKSDLESVRQQINGKESMLEAVVAEHTAAEELRDSNARIARVIGRISLYLDTLAIVDHNSVLQRTVSEAQAKVNRLQSLLEGRDADVEEKQESVLNRISSQMTEWAKNMHLEHSEWPFRLDIRHLTVAIDRPGRPISMQRIGGGENWLGCHIITLLALHKLFIQDNRPVPRFLILDQPTQVYFVSPTQYSSLGGTTQETMESDADLNAVRRMFGLLFDFCKDMAPKFQIIVLEHANLPENNYQQALVEEPWGANLALVPFDWAQQ